MWTVTTTSEYFIYYCVPLLQVNSHSQGILSLNKDIVSILSVSSDNCPLEGVFTLNELPTTLNSTLYTQTKISLGRNQGIQCNIFTFFFDSKKLKEKKKRHAMYNPRIIIIACQ